MSWRFAEGLISRFMADNMRPYRPGGKRGEAWSSHGRLCWKLGGPPVFVGVRKGFGTAQLLGADVAGTRPAPGYAWCASGQDTNKPVWMEFQLQEASYRHQEAQGAKHPRQHKQPAPVGEGGGR